jgi:hypothetical protein
MTPREHTQAVEVRDWHVRLAEARARFAEKRQRGEWPPPKRDTRTIETFRMESGVTEEELKQLPF